MRYEKAHGGLGVVARLGSTAGEIPRDADRFVPPGSEDTKGSPEVLYDVRFPAPGSEGELDPRGLPRTPGPVWLGFAFDVPPAFD